MKCNFFRKLVTTPCGSRIRTVHCFDKNNKATPANVVAATVNFNFNQKENKTDKESDPDRWLLLAEQQQNFWCLWLSSLAAIVSKQCGTERRLNGVRTAFIGILKCL